MKIVFASVLLFATGIGPVLGDDPIATIEGVVESYDGDGIYDGDLKIRLWGIDADELGTEEGEASLEALTRFNGRLARCYRPPGNKRYPMSKDRVVALCKVAGVDLAGWQVEHGHARDWPLFSDGYYSR